MPTSNPSPQMEHLWTIGNAVDILGAMLSVGAGLLGGAIRNHI